MYDSELRNLLTSYLAEDIGEGDHSSLASIPFATKGRAVLLVKQPGIIAGLRIAKLLFETADKELQYQFLLKDGDTIKTGDKGFYISGNVHSILRIERLVLNILQRMSGIATSTNEFARQLNGLKTKILDTRKTTPGFRFFEKEAVRIGGGINHRMGLYDMIMLKDNHIDYAGGIEKCINQTREYLRAKNLDLKIEIEARNLDDIRKIMAHGGVDRIMLDNFSIEDTCKAVKIINGRFETESSGGINLSTIRSYASCGVDFISVGALTHQINSLDMSLKAI